MLLSLNATMTALFMSPLGKREEAGKRLACYYMMGAEKNMFGIQKIVWSA